MVETRAERSKDGGGLKTLTDRKRLRQGTPSAAPWATNFLPPCPTIHLFSIAHQCVQMANLLVHSSIDQVTSCIQSLPKSPHRHTPGDLLVSPYSTKSTHQLSHPWRNSPCSRQQESPQGAALRGLKASKAKPAATTDWSLGILTQYRFPSPSSGVHSQPEVWHSAAFST